MKNPESHLALILDELPHRALTAGAAIAEPKVAAYHASYARNLFDALLDRGFTDEQALSIVCAYGLASISSVPSR